MNVTLLYFDGCPHWRLADEHLRTLAAEVPGLVVERRTVDTSDAAAEVGFRGSPSFLVDGVDPFGGEGDPVGLSCRIYRTPTGPAGTPTIDQLREVIGHD